jgi:hypothetical protein
VRSNERARPPLHHRAAISTTRRGITVSSGVSSVEERDDAEVETRAKVAGSRRRSFGRPLLLFRLRSFVIPSE